jgi:CRISPR-associated endonuclease Csn1
MLRFGLDVGTNSIGWCVFETENGVPVRLQAANSRIFSGGREPVKKEPLAVGCRMARGARVRRDRIIERKQALLKKLIELGLIPSDETERQALKLLNPYELRAKAVFAALTPHELGRVLMNLAQRRGFKSNRKSDSKEDAKKTRPDLDALAKALTESGLTLGQYLWQERLEKNESTRSRIGEGLYPQRQQYEDEFKIIRSTQEQHHAQVAHGDWNEIFDELFFQRPLRGQEVGYCQVYFEQHEKRAPIALPSYQKFRSAQNIANLQIISADRANKKRLDLSQRKLLAEALQGQRTMAFSKIRKLLKLHEGETFNLESERREKLEGNETAALLSDKKYFGKTWFDLSDAEQDTIALYLLDADAPAIMQKAEQDWKLPVEQAKNLAELVPEDFPKGYARFGHRALQELVEILTEQGISTTEAIMELRGKRGDNSVRREHLPYYGEILQESMIPSPKRGDADTKQYGKINNPTVHIGLNQIRKLVNELIDTYGAPDEIFLELARELKLNSKAKAELEKFQNKNQKLNDEAKQHMQESGITPSDEDIKKYKLWKELAYDVNDRCCPYSGQPINMTALWSDVIEIEHILPEAKTFDSSMKNLTVAFKEANRLKGNRAPDDAFNVPGSPYLYQDIIDRVQRSSMSPHKKKKFDPGAMKTFTDDPKNGFIARQMTDTQYLAKVARKYLLAVCEQVHVLPGQLTARIRHEWGLNAMLASPDATPEKREKKNRDDHRHHAIDAIVIACTDRTMLQKASKASGRDGKNWDVHFDPPWERDQFRRDVADVIGKAIVSHKADHGIQAKLHEDTYYGIIKDERRNDYERENNYNVVKRGDFRGHFAKVTPDKAANKIALIRDPLIRQELEVELSAAASVADITHIVDAYAKRKGIRRIRLLKKEATVQAVTHLSTSGQKFEKGIVPGSNHHVAFWKLPSGEIKARGCSFFELNSVKGDMNQLKPHPAAKLVCRLHKKDLVRVYKNGKEETCVITKLTPSEGNETITMRIHSDSDGGGFAVSFSQLGNYKLRKIHITPAGKVHDSGSMF